MSIEPRQTVRETVTYAGNMNPLTLSGYMGERSPVPLIAVEGSTHLVRYVNPAFCQLIGKLREEIVDQSFAEAVPVSEFDRCFPLLERVYRTGQAENLEEPDSLHPTASKIYWSYVVWPVFANDMRPAGILIQVTDATEETLFRRRVTSMNQELLLSSVRQHELREVAEGMNHRLLALASTDGLTGLYNHRKFQELLGEEIERSRRYKAPLSLLFLDVDDFKSYNDMFGHPAGDRVLRKVSEELRATARTNDMVARYGDEEFAVILTETDAEDSIVAAERFRTAIERAPWHERRITVSVGAATISETLRDQAALIANADAALYRAKARGRNCTFHTDDTKKTVARPVVTNRQRHLLPAIEPFVQFALAEFRTTVQGALETIGESLQISQEAMVMCLSRLMESRDEDTQEHSVRVTELMMRLARAVGMSAEEVLLAKWGGLLHDIGKTGIPDAILHKPGKLTKVERTVMQRHPVHASEMLATLPFLVGPALDIPRYHHEKWDGSGYPYGLRGETIPLSARLFAVVDVYDALLSDRPYRRAWTREAIRQYLNDAAGTHFDPTAVAAFTELLDRHEEELGSADSSSIRAF